MTVSIDSPVQQPGILKLFLSGASAACIAEGLTLPLDTAKVRLQLQTKVLSSDGLGPRHSKPKYRGPFQTVVKIISEEGFHAPFKGLVPGLHRQFLFTGVRLGMYEPVKRLLGGEGHGTETLAVKLGAAVLTSAAGISIAQPSDVVKVRFQAHSDLTARPYHGSLDAYRRILRDEGLLAGLYRGYFPNLIRNICISSTEIVSYDLAKHKLLDMGFQDGLPVHLSSAVCAGLAATVIGSPADVVGTRIMVLTTRPALASFCLQILRNEGISAFYKGFIPNFARLASFNITLWISYEEIRKLMNIPTK
mmetsp:Transcript_19948/g.60300  ORF Transcript_19948/g.60300 Transcript_19948/m.60300 type:complete len:306 (+) Transcript_19948:346-1263(+)